MYCLQSIKTHSTQHAIIDIVDKIPKNMDN